MSHELAWAAGFIDGEGSFGLQRQWKKRLPYLQAAQVDRRVLDRLQEAVGSGKVYGPYTRKSKNRTSHKEFFYYRLTGNEKVALAAKQLWPWLSVVKREQYTTAMEEFNEPH